MIEVIISEVQYVDGCFRHISARGTNKRSFKKATAAARKAFARAELGGTPTVGFFTIKKDGKILVEKVN
jgi:hypothetical protein